MPRRRRWWATKAGLGVASARQVEVFIARHQQLTERAQALVAQSPRGVVVPWEPLRLLQQVDGSQGQFRAPRATCTLNADNDYACRAGMAGAA
ncbi:hypothetical protein CTP10_R80030 (plasmid) [Cupriavidus sp. P-10]|nr:hypothetical protein CTP10_R80030 [Cupriavidus sp. P-10]